MIATIIVSLITVVFIIASILFFPRLQFKKISFDTYWVAALIGASIILILNLVKEETVWQNLTNDSEINPLKILSLFLAMTLLSVFLDELGFFHYVANWAHQKAKNKQASVFLWFYIVVSILTIFTSNDIIILTFTPFICSFARKAKINPLPYLISEFIAANTWSNMLIIGNPTNIYLATSFGIDFFEYFKVMWLPSVAAGLTSLALTYFIFRKDLKAPIEKSVEQVKLPNKALLLIGLIHLGGCTILLSMSSYIQIPMWFISLIFATSLIVSTLLYQLFTKSRQPLLSNTIKRLPWNLIPFVLSMFIMVLALKEHDITLYLSHLFEGSFAFFGIGAFFFANVLNNIPMSVMFAEVLRPLSAATLPASLYAVILASNIGAYLTPIGALAGIMWMNILKREQVSLSFIAFIKKNALIAMITMGVALATLAWTLSSI